MNNWIVYLLKCSDNSYYCGITNNLERRIVYHNEGKASRYTRVRRPVTLLISKNGFTKSEALKLEYKIKQQKREKKIEMLR